MAILINPNDPSLAPEPYNPFDPGKVEKMPIPGKTTPEDSSLYNGDDAEFKKYLESLAAEAKWNEYFQNIAMNFNREEAEKQRIFTSDENQAMRNWQKMMQDTYFQRSVADMKAAGLNPAMMYGSYSGGSSAIGSSMASGASSSIDYSGPSGKSFNFDNVVNSALKGADVISKLILSALRMFK